MAIVVKRDGRKVPFDEERIRHAMEMAFRAEIACPYPDPLAADVDDRVRHLTETVVDRLRAHGSSEYPIEQIQDEVERSLMAAGEYAVARRYIIYREARAARREGERLRVSAGGGRDLLIERGTLRQEIAEVCRGVVPPSEAEALYQEIVSGLYPGISIADYQQAKILAARTRIEREPGFSRVAARLVLDAIYREVARRPVVHGSFDYVGTFRTYLERGVELGRLSPQLLEFDLERMARALRPERDDAFGVLGIQILYDRYLIHDQGRRIEAPQHMWMRVAMGLSLGEREREERAIEFYEVLSTHRYVTSTPTLFNSGTAFPQMSSCFLTTVPDDLRGIFESIQDNAMLSKWSGGLGNDWTPVRALGAHIHGTNGNSQGIIPFLSVANATAVAVNQGGKRKGAVCAYLEAWHLDFPQFIELRRNVGDERLRTPDMNIAAWIPDLFMQRVSEHGSWTLFSPNEVPDLHDLYGQAFRQRYEEYEVAAERGELRQFQRVSAAELWRKLLSVLFETGHPWITFKDPCNIRSPQDHVGRVHSSNLCTEITLNTKPSLDEDGEIAVCNLGSVNLAGHIRNGALDTELLAQTVRVAMRALDNVIDLNLYPVEAARRSNLRHRPVGLGIMGFQDALYKLGISYASEEAVTFADYSMEVISYHAILASARLAAERGPYPSFTGSKWDRGLLPIDTIALLRQERGGEVDMDESTSLDWGPVRSAIREHGMRNSNCMAIAPTATIANIIGVSESIEPTYANLFAKSNLSGDFTVINESMVADLRATGLWDDQMVNDLKYYDGSLQDIDRVPDALKHKYLTVFETDPTWFVACAAARQKWIDQSQSFNLYSSGTSGRALSDLYLLAWRSGLKTTYYLRTLAATQIEKSTLDVNRYGVQPRWMRSKSASANVVVRRDTPSPVTVKACALDDPDCEACQ